MSLLDVFQRSILGNSKSVATSDRIDKIPCVCVRWRGEFDSLTVRQSSLVCKYKDSIFTCSLWLSWREVKIFSLVNDLCNGRNNESIESSLAMVFLHVSLVSLFWILKYRSLEIQKSWLLTNYQSFCQSVSCISKRFHLYMLTSYPGDWR